LISSEYAAEFGRLIPGSRVEIVDHCGHIPQLEQPEQTMSLVTTFLG
jgi:pimeloyl-ACP methyl ester carboxylesterase